MRRLRVPIILLSLFLCGSQASADQCDNAVNQHNAANEELKSWFRDALKREFRVSRWADIDWAEDNACQRILPIYQKQLSMTENVLSLKRTTQSICRNLKSVPSGGDGERVSAEESIARIKENIRLCEEVVSGKDDYGEPGEGEQEFKAASSTQPSATTGGSQPHLWLPTKENPDCGSANDLERQTAAYYFTCKLSQLPNPPKSATGHSPHIGPQALLKRAQQTCGSSSRETYRCIVDAKVKILLAEDPDIRESCQSVSSEKPSTLSEKLHALLGRGGDAGQRKALDECVDAAYVYGAKKEATTLRDKLRKVIVLIETEDARSGNSANTSSAPPSHCPPGEGMKPTPGADGAWSCQRLNGLYGKTSVNPNIADSDSVQAFEQRLKEIAATMAVEVSFTVGTNLSTEDRNLCGSAAYAAALSLLKGGETLVPEKCRAWADAARAELPYYADTHVDASNPAVEELLAYLNMPNASSGGDEQRKSR